MTYAIYYIHPQSLSVNIRDFYNKYETAVKRLKLDVEEYIKANKNVDKVDFVNKKKDINLKEDGYYLKISNKYPNRITIYEKTSRNDIGILYSSIVVNIKKILVFSLMELASLPDGINLDLNLGEVTKSVLPKIEILYIEELKEKLKDRINKYE